jgi:uncharacterized protein (DUF2236 family)
MSTTTTGGAGSPATGPYAARLAERAAEAFTASVPDHPADDGLFGPRSVTWRLAGDMTTPVVGIRALLLQALHPLAMAGVDQHSAWRTDPGARLASTSAYVMTVSVGDTAAARAAAARVRMIHEQVRGTDPATGRPYAATDPALLLWVHNALIDSQLACSTMFGTLTPADADRYTSEQVAAAELIGIPPDLAPVTVAQLEAYFDAVRPELTCTPAAASAMSYLLEYVGGTVASDAGASSVEASTAEADPEAAEMAQMWQDISDAAIASLPDWAIGLYREPVPRIAQARDRLGDMSAGDRAAIRQALGVLDALFLGEPGVLEARQRLRLRMRQAQ